jgi:elongation factor 1-beta
VTFKAVGGAPDAEKYPHAARWYKHIASYEPEFSTLQGDSSKAYSAYGPEAAELPADKPAGDDDDMDDLFGSDEEEDPEVVKEREARLAEYKKKKEAKPKPAAKSIVTLEVKPWGEQDDRPRWKSISITHSICLDDETNLGDMEKNVRSIGKDGLVWGASKLVAVGFGIKKLQINLVVEDEKISLEELQQQIEEDEDHVQSTDIVRPFQSLHARNINPHL